ncbi:MAG: hypothetical protein JXR30_00725 [Alphaproteobacteria bacterium]|nr:hypothetical protein [Alphaproteobacteria bacterium]
MFDLGFYEFILVAFVLFLIVPAKDFPNVLRKIIQFFRKIKNGFSEIMQSVSAPLDEFESIREDIRKEADSVKKSLKGKPRK